MRAASQLPGRGPLLWILPLYLHVNQNPICKYGFCSKELKNEFEIAVVNEPSVSRPLMFYCTCNICCWFISGERFGSDV